MGRKKTVPAGSDQANPLLRMLGTFWRLERSRLPRATTKSVAQELGLSDTYYRLVEAGGAALNQALSVRLMEVLAARSDALSSSLTMVQFQRLAVFLVGAQLVGAAMSESTGADAALRAVEALGRRDADFQLFHTRTLEYYSQRTDQAKQRFLEEEAAPEVKRFLSMSVYAESPSDAQIIERVLPARSLLELPTTNVEMLLRMLADLTDRPFVHAPRVGAKWEDRHARLFRNVRGVYAKSSMIVGQKNLDLFHYPYLSAKDFRSIRFLFLETGNSRNSKTDFINRLNKARKTFDTRLDPLTSEEKDKIDFKHLPKDAPNEIVDRLRNLRSVPIAFGESDEYQAYWSFETSLNLPISFVGRELGQTTDVLNLTLAAAIRKQDEFDHIWSELGATTN